MKFSTAALAIGVLGLAAPAQFQAQAQQITGAGATFPAPVYAKWGEAAKGPTGIELNYQAIGSGGGQTQIAARTVDFGASDAPMDPAKLESANLLQFPAVMGAVVAIANIPGVDAAKLMIDGPTLAAIYQGKISKWNDPKIAQANPGVALPSRAIAPVYRADGSGTTFVFASYLSAVDAEWKAKTGAATSVKWPTGQGARGNDGIAATVQNTTGAIGYVEYAYAKQNKLAAPMLRNNAGVFVAPSMAAFQAAASSANWGAAKNFAVDLIDQPGSTTWPIVSATFILLPKDPKESARSANVMKFFDWAYNEGDALASAIDYVPMPATVKAKVRAAWAAEVKGPDGKPVR